MKRPCQTKGHYPTVIMTCLPHRCRKVDKYVAVTLLAICEMVITKTTKPPVQRKNVTDKVIDALMSLPMY